MSFFDHEKIQLESEEKFNGISSTKDYFVRDSYLKDIKNATQFVDFQDNKNFLKYNPSNFPNIPDYSSLRPIKNTETNEEFFVLERVANDFKSLQNYMKIALLRGLVNVENHKRLVNIQPFLGFRDVRKEYELYLDNIFKKINERLKREQVFIGSLKDYLSWIERNFLSSENIVYLPFTFENFYDSLDNRSTGLIIHIDLTFSSSELDKQRDRYYLSREWPIFLDACKQTGFLPSSNFPWILTHFSGHSSSFFPLSNNKLSTFFSQPLDKPENVCFSISVGFSLNLFFRAIIINYNLLKLNIISNNEFDINNMSLINLKQKRELINLISFHLKTYLYELKIFSIPSFKKHLDKLILLINKITDIKQMIKVYNNYLYEIKKENKY